MLSSRKAQIASLLEAITKKDSKIYDLCAARESSLCYQGKAGLMVKIGTESLLTRLTFVQSVAQVEVILGSCTRLSGWSVPSILVTWFNHCYL